MNNSVRKTLRWDDIPSEDPTLAQDRKDDATLTFRTEEAELVSSVKSLLEKERKLFEIELLKRDREISRLKQQKSLNNSEDLFTTTVATTTSSITTTTTQPISHPALDALQIVSDPEYLSRLTVLDLCQVNVSETALYELSKVLPHVPNVVSLDLSENGLGNSHANATVAVITATQLTQLNLEENYFGTQAALSICRAVVHGNTITDLNLSANPFQKEQEAGKVLGKALCTSARLRRLKITMKDPKRDRDSGTSRGQSASFVSKIALMPSLEAVGFVHAEIPFVTLKSLVQHAVRTLVELDLSNAFIGLRGAALLSNELAKTNSLHSPVVLKQLTLSMNAVGNGGARSLSTALKTNKSLTSLGLNGNNITGSGLDALRDAICRNRTLTRLSLERNRFEEVTQALAFVQAVESPGCNIESVGDLEYLLMPEDLKSRLENALAARARSRLDEKNNSPDMVRIFAQGLPKRFKARAGRKEVEVLRLEIPNLCFPNPPLLPLLMHVSWQARYAWKICKEKNGEPVTLVKSGSKTATHAQLRGWEPHDVLVLYFMIPELPENRLAAIVQVDDLHVYAGNFSSTVSQSRQEPDRVVYQGFKSSSLHDTAKNPLCYVPANEVELCEYAQNDVLVLRWSVCLTCAQGSKRYNRIVRQFGVDWKLEIRGAGYSFKRGSSKDMSRTINNRLEYEVAIEYDDKSMLSIGDRICLWMRPSSELPGHLTRFVGGVLPLTICCSQVRLSVRKTITE